MTKWTASQFQFHCHLLGHVSRQLTPEVPDEAWWSCLYSTTSSFLRARILLTSPQTNAPVHCTILLAISGIPKSPITCPMFGWRVPNLVANHSPFQYWQLRASPVICINSRTIEESCEDTSVPTNGVQRQRDPIHGGEQEHQKRKNKCLMI